MRLLKWPQKTTAEYNVSASLQKLLDSLNDVVLILNQNNQIEFINSCWQKLVGLSVKETYHQLFSEFIHPEDRANWHKRIQTIKQDSNEIIWLRLLTQNREIRWCEIRLQPMLSNSLYPLSATLRDITPQVREEQIRQAGHRSLKSLVDRLPAMLYRARNNKSWTMEYVSNGCDLITGYTPETMLNQSQICLGTMIHIDDASNVWEQVQRALHMHTTFDLTYRLKQANGREVIVQDKGQGIYSDSGMILGVEGIIFKIND